MKLEKVLKILKMKYNKNIIDVITYMMSKYNDFIIEKQFCVKKFS